MGEGDKRVLDFGLLRVGRLPLGKDLVYEASLKMPWVRELFGEMEPIQLESEENQLDIEMTVRRLPDHSRDCPVIVTGEIRLTYFCSCVRCLEDCKKSESLPFGAFFLSNEFEKNPEYEELDTVFEEQKELDLYFMEGGELDLLQLFREVILIGIDPFPLHDENCLGLCQECGHNLNESPCNHGVQTH